MLGESIETSAGDPTMAGRAIRVVGTNPFIVGSEAEEGNIFLEILRKNPDIQCYNMNTGMFGGTEGENITVKDSVRIIEMIARGTIKWKHDDYWGFEVPEEIPGIDMERFNLANYYEPAVSEALSAALREERVEWLERFEDLDPKIINAIRGQ
jgi:phosphoenolpyruvate carboxykinase (ATP)